MTDVLVLGALFGAGSSCSSRPSRSGLPGRASPAGWPRSRPRPADRIAPARAGVPHAIVRGEPEAGAGASGEGIARILGRLGLDLRATEERLRAAGDRGGLALFEGQKLAGALIGFSFLPAAESFGLAPVTPVWLWLAAAAAGFLLPDAMLKRRAESRRRRMREDLVHFAELVSLAVSAGLGVEGALDQAVGSGRGRCSMSCEGSCARGAFAGSRPRRRSLGSPRRSDSRCGAARRGDPGAADHGTAVTQALRAQARALRDRRRLELVEAAERAQVRMLLPVGSDPAGLLRRRALPGSGATASADRAMRREVS